MFKGLFLCFFNFFFGKILVMQGRVLVELFIKKGCLVVKAYQMNSDKDSYQCSK